MCVHPVVVMWGVETRDHSRRDERRHHSITLAVTLTMFTLAVTLTMFVHRPSVSMMALLCVAHSTDEPPVLST